MHQQPAATLILESRSPTRLSILETLRLRFTGSRHLLRRARSSCGIYNRNATPPAEPNFLGQGNTQCTNVTTPGSCTGTLTNVPAGGQLTLRAVQRRCDQRRYPGGPGPVGCTAGGFTGYIIAQAGFQYCHGFAFISKQGAGFEADNLAMGYLAIVLDQPGAAAHRRPRRERRPVEVPFVVQKGRSFGSSLLLFMPISDCGTFSSKLFLLCGPQCYNHLCSRPRPSNPKEVFPW